MKNFLLVLTIILLNHLSVFSQSDNCVTATTFPLIGGSGCQSGTTTGSTSESIMFGACNAAPANEVWYTYVATGSQNDLTIIPSGLTETEIVLYTGGCPSNGGALVTCQTVTGTNTLNQNWGFTAGTQIWVGIMSNAGTDGDFDLCIDSYDPPAGGGNGCAGAIPLCDASQTYNIPDMSIFTASGASPPCFPGGGNQDVWFQFTVTQTGQLAWDISATSGSGIEWDWSIYDITGGCPTNPAQWSATNVACNYNYSTGSGVSGMNCTSATACPINTLGGTAEEYCPCITVTAGNTYVIQIDNYTNTVATGLDFTFGPDMTALIAPDVDFTIATPVITCGNSVTVNISDMSIGVPTWDFGDGTTFIGNNPPDHTYTTPGTYAITATIGGACPDIQTEFIQLFGPLVTVSSQTDETCVGDCDGSAAVVTTGGSGTYTYLWSPGGETTPSISNLCSGNYSVAVTDNICATNNVENITITGPPCVNCVIDSIPISLTNCYVSGAGFLVYDVAGTMYYTDPPATGTLTITACDGQQVIVSAPFGTSSAFTFSGLPQGSGICDFSAVFSDEPACTFTQGFQSPPPILGFNVFCTVGGGFVNGDITFDDSYASGTLVISVFDGSSTFDTIINLPTTSPQNWSISGLDPTANPYIVDYFFSDYQSCGSQLAINCGCAADAGTVTTTLTGNGLNNYILCDGDQIDITTNGDYVHPDDIGPIGSGPTYAYQPELVYLAYSCPPTPGLFPTSDPCFVGLIPSPQDLTDINNPASYAATLPGGPYTELWFAQTNLYHYDPVLGNYIYNANCWDIGPGIQVTYLSPIATPAVPDCQNSDVTVTLTGGYPQAFGGDFTASNLLPATAGFVNTTCPHGGTIVINGLQNGDLWSFDVVDDNGCPISVSGGPFVGLPDAQAGIDDTICGTLTYNLAATPSIGIGTWTGPAGITFSNVNSATSSITAVTAGSYTLTWTEDNGGGCISIDQVTISLSNPSFTDIVTPAICGLANGQIDITASGGITPYSYSIDNGATTQGTGTFPALSANTYQGWIQDNVGCQFAQNIIINNTGSPAIDSVVATDPLCNGDCNGQLIIYGSGGSPPYEYSLDGITFVLGQDTWTGLCAGTQDVYVQDAAGCPNSSSVTLSDPPALNLVLDLINHVDCNGDATGEIRITVSGGTFPYSYLWTGPGGPYTADDIDLLTAGTYDLTVTDANGCVITYSETINEPAPLTITFSTFDASCAGVCDGSAIVIPAGGTVAAGYTYTWSGGIAGNVPNAAGLCQGTYDLNVQDDNGCSVDTLAWDIISPPSVTFSSVVTVDETCNGSCDGSVTVASATATQYSLNGATFSPVSTFNGMCAGTNTITAQDANGCAVDTTINIASPPPVFLNVSIDTTICIGGTATITATGSGGMGGYTYSWDSGDLTQTINVSPVANQTYCATVTDINGCPALAPACVNINIYDQLQVTALSSQGICPGDLANISAIASGGDGNYNYSWDNGIGPGQAQNVAPGATTIYTVTVTDGCETPAATDNLTITVNSTPIVDFNPDVNDGCLPVTVNFTESGQPTGSQCFWDFGDGNADVNCGVVTNTYNDPGCYDVTLTVVSDLGCTDQVTYPNLICVFPYPNAEFSFGPQPTSVLNTTINFSNESTGADNYNWEFGTNGILGSSTATDPNFLFPNDVPGTYQVCLLATTDYGCQDSTCQYVIIDEDFIVYVPNAFSPDQDNINETFTPVVIGADPLNYQFYVFNRWGELIYNSQIPGQGWDGTFKGMPAQQDIYVWKLEVVNQMNNQKHQYKGHVTLLK